MARDANTNGSPRLRDRHGPSWLANGKEGGTAPTHGSTEFTTLQRFFLVK